MYNANDAVARVDSYIVSIGGAARFVGDRRMIRIESVDRASASAVLIGEDGEPVPVGDPGEGAAELESGSAGRRRGRRGGRGRRSRAESTSGESRTSDG